MQTDRQRARRTRSASIGRLANELKQAIEARWAAVPTASRDAGAAPARVDVTLPGRVPLLGHRHPLTIVRDRMEEIFTRMGFAIVEGPEVEDEWHCFDALNMPAEHPARDMQDTLYLATPIAGDSGRPTTCGRCCGRTPRRCRSATCRRTSRRSASSCPAASIGATIST